MSTSWTLTASDICTDALRHLNVVGEGDTPSGDQFQVALRGLDVVLKELPLFGYSWPKLSGEVALTWAGVQAMALPADYYGNPYAWKTADTGKKYPLVQIPHAQWVQMPDRTATGVVTHFYVSPDGVFNVWPVPATDPGVFLQYQRVVDDSSVSVTPDVLQTWKGSLSFGVADHIGLQCSAPQATRVEVAQRWTFKRNLMLQNAVPAEVISFEVRE